MCVRVGSRSQMRVGHYSLFAFLDRSLRLPCSLVTSQTSLIACQPSLSSSTSSATLTFTSSDLLTRWPVIYVIFQSPRPVDLRLIAYAHDLGGSLDIVIRQSDMPLQYGDVVDVGLSYHRLLRWLVPMVSETPVYVASSKVSWKRLDSRDAWQTKPLKHWRMRSSVVDCITVMYCTAASPRYFWAVCNQFRTPLLVSLQV